MYLLNRTISINDFIPPILMRIWNKYYFKNTRYHPFNYLPNWVEPSWFLDIGANIGDVTKNALKTFPSLKAICFEPVSSTFIKLKANLNPFDNRVIYFNKGLSNENRKTKINITSFHGANSIENQTQFHSLNNSSVFETGKEEIEICRLDDIVSDLPTSKIDIVKIDVEGHELNVLKGGQNFIENAVDIVIIEIALQRDISFEQQRYIEIFSEMKQLGFALINAYDLHNTKFKPKPPIQRLMLAQFDCVFARVNKLRDLK